MARKREPSSFQQVVLKNYKAEVLLTQIQEESAEFPPPALLDYRRTALAVQFEYQPGTSRPLHLMTIANTPSGRLLCCIDIHHAITDGYSIMTMFADLERAYMGALPVNPEPSLRQFVGYLVTSIRKPPSRTGRIHYRLDAPRATATPLAVALARHVLALCELRAELITPISEASACSYWFYSAFSYLHFMGIGAQPPSRGTIITSSVISPIPATLPPREHLASSSTRCHVK